MRLARGFLAVIAVAALSACATLDENGSTLGTKKVTPEMVIDSSPLAEGLETEDFSQIDIMALTPEMVVFLDEAMGGVRNRYARMKRLVHAVMGEDNFRLIYDDSTRTAQGTFEARQGNCLSFTNMFIAMARYVGIQAEYQEVDIPPDWSMNGQSFLFSQHVNVRLDLGADEIRVVDFNMYDFNVMYDKRIISDQRARAHYFSNIGADYMLNGDNPSAFANFRQAVLEDRSFASAWINLGVLHRREGYPNYAETALKQALSIDQFNLIAMSNLANLYGQEGFTENAEFYQQKVRSHRMTNPYYRYHLAQSAVVDGDYGTAIDNLEYAIRKREGESRFYFLMSVAYLMSGDQEKADAFMAKADELAAGEADRQRYHNKLDRLMGLDEESRQ